jgi:hypothetical protein
LYEGDILENDGDWYQIGWDADQGRWEAAGTKSTHESLALCEQGVLTIECNRADGAFDDVGIDLDEAVIDEARQPLPAR